MPIDTLVLPNMFGICLKMLNHGSPQIPRGPFFSGASSLEVGDATRAQAYLDALQEDVGDVKLVMWDSPGLP